MRSSYDNSDISAAADPVTPPRPSSEAWGGGEAGGTSMMDVGLATEWTAVLLNLAGAWWVGSLKDREQRRGFAFLLAANLAWMAWSWQHSAWGLFTMQIAFIGLNVRGIVNHLRPRPSTADATECRHAH